MGKVTFTNKKEFFSQNGMEYLIRFPSKETPDVLSDARSAPHSNGITLSMFGIIDVNHPKFLVATSKGFDSKTTRDKNY